MLKNILNKLKKRKYKIKKRIKKRFVDHYFRKIIPIHSHFLYYLNMIKEVPGAIVEAGVRSGNSIIAITSLAKSIGIDRNIIAIDSFEGFPIEEINKYKKKYNIHLNKQSKDSMEIIKDNFNKSNLSIENVFFLKGYFEDTLPKYNYGSIAFLHIDVDLGKSYKTVLECLYKYVSKEGIVLFDEYDDPVDLEKWPDAKIEIDDFLKDKKFEEVRSSFTNKYVIKKID